MRIYMVSDVHAFGGEGPIIIGGVRIPYEKDCCAFHGDVALHVLTDALLGAAALGRSAALLDTDPGSKVPIAASCYAKPGVVFRRGLYPWQRRCHYHRSGTEGMFPPTFHKCAFNCRRSRLPYG